jgi:hypothetical protein
MVRTNNELFDILRGLHVPGLNKHSDELVKLCEIGMEKRPEDLLVNELLEIAISTIVAATDRTEIGGQIDALTPEAQEIFRSIEALTDDQLKQMVDEGALSLDCREWIAQILFHRDEERRLAEEIMRTLLDHEDAPKTRKNSSKSGAAGI